MQDHLYEALQNLAIERGQSVAFLIEHAVRGYFGLPEVAGPGSRAHDEQLEMALRRHPVYAVEITRAIRSSDLATPDGRPADALRMRTFSPTKEKRLAFRLLFENAQAHIAAGRPIPWLTLEIPPESVARTYNEQIKKALVRCPEYAGAITVAINANDLATPDGRPSNLLRERIYQPTRAQRKDFKLLFEDAKAHLAAGRTVPWLTLDTK